jgi:NADH:ubiquinone oxidoreductase subunit F (NADH-binding)
VSEPRLLKGIGLGAMSFERHREVHGPPIGSGGPRLRRELLDSGLRGRGGAAFPLAAKLNAVVRARGRPIVVANGCEGEPMSTKDHVLMTRAPHLIIDGALMVADAVDADEILFAVDEHDKGSAQSMQRALDERPDLSSGRPATEIVSVPPGYVSGQETALVRWCNGQEARPTAPWPRVTERGIRGRPTLVSNTETLAHAGLAVRQGARWLRQAGTQEHPGTTLVTLSGAVVSPGVFEIEHGLPLRDLLRDAGGPSSEVVGFLIGGYAGGWVDPALALHVRLESQELARVGARLGPGIVVALPADACPVAETARVAGWMAAQSAGQCGPCVHGLAAIARALADACTGHDGRRALADLARWTGQIPGRGACAHPDGAVGLVISALRVFREDFLDHAQYGSCDACDRPGVLEVPGRAMIGR